MLDITTGQVIGSLHARHRAIEFKKAGWNETRGPYVWSKTAEQILDRITRYCNRMNASGHERGSRR